MLVGDPDQLTSIEAGAVLGDIVGGRGRDGVVALDHVFRFGAGIGDARVRDPRAASADEVLAVAARRAGRRDAGSTWTSPSRTRWTRSAPVRDGARWRPSRAVIAAAAGRGRRGRAGGARRVPGPVRAPARLATAWRSGRRGSRRGWRASSTAGAGTRGGRCW